MKKEVTKKERTLKAYQEHVGEFYCSYCASGSGQPAATIRSLRQDGYNFEKTSFTNWGKEMYCPHCKENRTHYKLLSTELTNEENHRFTITDKDRKRVSKLLGNVDAFTGAKSQTKLEIDHKEPFTIRGKDIKISLLTDNEIIETFQYLTPDHNKLKNSVCQRCKKYNERPPFFGINFYYEGDTEYKGSCVGCGWYDGVKWRQKLNEKLNKNNI